MAIFFYAMLSGMYTAIGMIFYWACFKNRSNVRTSGSGLSIVCDDYDWRELAISLYLWPLIMLWSLAWKVWLLIGGESQ